MKVINYLPQDVTTWNNMIISLPRFPRIYHSLLFDPPPPHSHLFCLECLLVYVRRLSNMEPKIMA